METMVFTGFIMLLVVGVVVNIWRMIMRVFSTVFFFALGVVVLGFLFGGTEAFTSGTTSDWTDIANALLGEGTGERVVNAFLTFVNQTWEIIKNY